MDASEIALRLGAAVIAGLLLGMEREAHGRAAGLRTVVLVCLAGAAAMVLSEAIFADASPDPGPGWRPDPARLAAGVLAGIGFIGAGTIMRHGHLVRGVTTAAVIWLATIAGLCCGAGHMWLGLGTAVLGLAALTLLPAIESLADNDWYANLTVVTSGTDCDADDVTGRLAELELKIKQVSIDCDLEQHRHTLRFAIKLKRRRRHAVRSQAMALLSSLPEVQRIAWDV